MIIDGYVSYMSTEFIKFTRAYKIIYACLPIYLTNLLQPLDVNVFGPLKQNYKKLVVKKTRFSTYNLDKADFILLIQKARQYGITSRNIQSAWRAIWLIPYNPSMAFQKLSVHEDDTLASNQDNIGAGLITPIQARFHLGVIPPTPGNV